MHKETFSLRDCLLKARVHQKHNSLASIFRCLTEATANLSTAQLRQSFSKDNPCVSNSQQCTEWIYDFEFLYGYRSMTSDLNWVCQHAWKSIAGQSAYFVGSVVGTLVLGILADAVGRLPILIVAHLFGIIGNALTIFATNEVAFALCRFISGIATDNNFVMFYILLLEYIQPRMRTLGLNLCIGLFYCLGSVVTPWLAVWLGNWKLYLLATIVPALVVPSLYFIIPESAEWLISKGRLEEALECYQRIGKFNRRKLDEKFIEDFRNCADGISERRIKSNEKSPSLLALFRTPRLRRLTLILFFKS
jgi:OCT family organic cation transporter-like MFS transporter 4/5